MKSSKDIREGKTVKGGINKHPKILPPPAPVFPLMKNVRDYPERLKIKYGQSMKQFGFLFGGYVNKCGDCKGQFTGAKRCGRCLDCAIKASQQHKAKQAEAVALGYGLLADAIPEGWEKDNVVLVARPFMNIMADLGENTPSAHTFFVTLRNGGCEVYAGSLKHCVEFVRRCEETHIQDDPDKMEAMANEIDLWC